MKERPILFQGAMVRAPLEGGKTQTRRILKPAPTSPDFDLKNVTCESGYRYAIDTSKVRFPEPVRVRWDCPYGQPGDRLWVRETFFAYGRWETRYSEKKNRDEWHFVDMTAQCDRVYQYDADNPDVPLAKGRGVTPGWWKRPAIFMPRAACRIQLEIVSVRVERLNDCSAVDATAEGVMPDEVRQISVFGASADERAEIYRRAAVAPYERLWESINGADSWAANPWVWVIDFCVEVVS